MVKKPSTGELEEVLLDEAYNIDPIVHDGRNVMKKLLCVLFLAGLFMAIEIVGGLLANSIAILSDAAHMLSDLLGFVISIISIYISGLPANTKHSFGYHRAGVIGALASIMVIWALTGFLIYFAVRRVINIDEVEVEGPLMFGVACFGLLTNLVMIKVLHGGEGHSHGHSHGHDHGHGHSHSHGHAHSHSHTRGIASKHVHEHEHKHGEEHAHDLEHEHKHDHEHEHGEHKHDHEHDHEHKHEHEHEHKHDHEHEHEHEHKHDHDHDHDHEHEREEEKTVAISIREDKREIEVHRKGQNLSVTSDTDNLNVRATIIHILGDILQSIGVIIASILVWISPDKLKIADPIVTFIFAMIVLYTTIRVAKDCIFVLMEGTPAELDIEEFEQKLRGIEGVVELHDLHVWSLGVGKPSMSAHIYASRDTGAVLKKATKICRTHGIFHSTIQVETTQDKLHADYIECVHNIH